MKKKKAIILCFIVVMSSIAIFSMTTTNITEENNIAVKDDTETQLTIEFDSRKPKTAAYQTYNDLWIDDTGGSPGANGTWSYINETYSWCTWTGSEYILEDITLTNPDNTGSPLLIANSTVPFIIRNCTFSNSEIGSYLGGITLDNTDNGKIFDCIQSNNDVGIYLRGTSLNNLIKNNTIDNSNSYGIYLWILNNGNDIINNTITNSGSRNIYLDTSHNCIIGNNTIEGGYAGIYLISSNNVVVINNTIRDSLEYVIYIHNKLYVELSGNTLSHCGIYTYFDSVTYFKSSTIYLNNTVNGKPVYFYMDEIGLDSSDFTYSGQPGQIILVNCSYCDISNFNISDATTGITLAFSEYNTISNNIANDQFSGIHMNYECNNNTLFNNTVKDNYYGIWLERYCYDNNITRNICQRNVGLLFSCGIQLYYSDRNNVTHNLLTTNRNGIILRNSEDNIILNNTAYDNVEYGIYLRTQSKNNLIINNTATDTSIPTQDAGLYIRDECDNNNVTNNVFTGNYLYGVYIWDDCYENNISNNDISGNGQYNLYLRIGTIDPCDHNTFVNNNLSNSGQHGVYIDTCHNNTFINNDISNNQGDGVRMGNSNSNIFVNNDISNNQVDGVDMIDCISNNFTGNTIKNNGMGGGGCGITAEGCDSNNIIDNLIDNNNYGIVWVECDFSTLKGNVIENNNWDGIFFDYTIYNNITENTIRYNGGIGLNIDFFSSGNLIWLNFFVQNGIHAQDDGAPNNDWNYTIGNYWDNYTDPAIGGDDSDGDGIGDVNYPIGTPIADNDTLPIWDDAAPMITIIDPKSNSKKGDIAPDFNVRVQEKYLLWMWYSLDNWKTNVTFTQNGTIDQALWDAVGNGIVRIKFYAEDKTGRNSTASVLVQKNVPSALPGAADDDDDDDDDLDDGGAVVVVIIVVIACLGAFVCVIYVLIQKGIIDISKLKRK